MIITMLLFLVQGLFGAIFYFLPVVNLASIPVIGESIRNTLITVMHTWNAFLVTFPYAEVVWICFKAIIAFEILMLVVKFFLGHRAPVQH